MWVQFLYGEIPSTIGHLSESLRVLQLSNNELANSIPSEIGELPNLYSLDISHNEIRGTLPSELGELTQLQSLSLRETSLLGALPRDLLNMTSLRTLGKQRHIPQSCPWKSLS